ncbi:MAG: transposase [Bacteroidota bacterium]
MPDILENGDTLKQLLVRSKYLLFKNESNWTPSQAERAEILFRLYPSLENAYKLCRELSWIFNKSANRLIAFKKLALWYNKIEQAGFKSFNTVSRTIQNHYQNILNYFDNTATNASVESFNAKTKALEANLEV